MEAIQNKILGKPQGNSQGNIPGDSQGRASGLALFPYLQPRLYHTGPASFEDQVERLLAAYAPTGIPLRLLFFGAPAGIDDYRTQLAYLEQVVAQRWSQAAPLVSYLAQPLPDGGMALEVHEVPHSLRSGLSRRRVAGLPYWVCETVGWKRIWLHGLLADRLHGSIAEQSQRLFAALRRLMEAEQMPLSSIVRQWNYIERITAFTAEGHQHYQDFNEARTAFYASGTWEQGYPAATGIGTQTGGVLVDADLLRVNGVTDEAPDDGIWGAMREAPDARIRIAGIDNGLQVPAHAYSQDVLLGKTPQPQKTTPKFERAKLLTQAEAGWVYISGTAAIRGEVSLSVTRADDQTRTTLENIAYLLSKENLQKQTDWMINSSLVPLYFRVYVKCAEDFESVRQVVGERFPALPVLYVQADICRDDLAVEIEGMVQLSI